MSDAAAEGLQCHPEGDTAGRKGRVRKGPREAACWLVWRNGRGMSADLWTLASASAESLCSDQPRGCTLPPFGSVWPPLLFVLISPGEGVLLWVPLTVADSLGRQFAAPSLQPDSQNPVSGRPVGRSWECSEKSLTLCPSYMTLA